MSAANVFVKLILINSNSVFLDKYNLKDAIVLFIFAYLLEL